MSEKIRNFAGSLHAKAKQNKKYKRLRLRNSKREQAIEKRTKLFINNTKIENERTEEKDTMVKVVVNLINQKN